MSFLDSLFFVSDLWRGKKLNKDKEVGLERESLCLLQVGMCFGIEELGGCTYLYRGWWSENATSNGQTNVRSDNNLK